MKSAIESGYLLRIALSWAYMGHNSNAHALISRRLLHSHSHQHLKHEQTRYLSAYLILYLTRDI